MPLTSRYFRFVSRKTVETQNVRLYDRVLFNQQQVRGNVKEALELTMRRGKQNVSNGNQSSDLRSSAGIRVDQPPANQSDRGGGYRRGPRGPSVTQRHSPALSCHLFSWARETEVLTLPFHTKVFSIPTQRICPVSLPDSSSTSIVQTSARFRPSSFALIHIRSQQKQCPL